MIEATRYIVLPIDDRMFEKINPDTAGRPVLIRAKTQLLFGGMGHLSENCVLNIKNKSHSVTAEIVVPTGGAEGVMIAQGADIGGWSLYAKVGKVRYCYNWGGFKHFIIEGEVGATLAMLFSADDGCDIGKDVGSAVSPDYKSGDNAFNGQVKGVLLSIEEDDGQHMVDPVDAIRMALVRQ